MNCWQARRLLQRYVDGELRGHLADELRRHLRACGECAQELEQLQGTVSWLEGLPPVKAEADLTDRVMASIAVEATAPARQRWSPGSVWPILAAICVGALVLMAAEAMLLATLDPSALLTGLSDLRPLFAAVGEGLQSMAWLISAVGGALFSALKRPVVWVIGIDLGLLAAIVIAVRLKTSRNRPLTTAAVESCLTKPTDNPGHLFRVCVAPDG